MKNRISKNSIIVICILLILLFIIVILIKNKVDEKGRVNNILSNSIDTAVEEEDDDNEPAIDEDSEDKYKEETSGETEIDKSQMPAETEKEGLRDALYTETPREVTSPIYYATVKNILQTFLKDIGTMSMNSYINKTDIYSISNNDLRKKAYDRLSEDYKKKHEIDINNITEKLKISYTEFSVNIEKMMQYAIKNNQILRFAVRLNIQDDEESTKVNNFIVYLDYENQSYSIEPIGNGNIEEIKLDSDIKEIEKNNNNLYIYMNEE